MKKFIAFLILLIIIASVVFFVGWTQFKVKPDYCGIITSKTSGIDDNIILPGKFSWHWECLLPTNSQLRVFSVKPYTTTKNINSSLPSSEIYSSVFGSSLDFSYNFDFAITLRVTPENILALVKNNTISDDENLKEYFEKIASTVANKSVSYILEKSYNDNFTLESVTSKELIENIKSSNEFSNVIFENIIITSSKLPDRVLYNKAREAYIELQKAKQQRNVEREKELNELLSKFPELKEKFIEGDTIKSLSN